LSLKNIGSQVVNIKSFNYIEGLFIFIPIDMQYIKLKSRGPIVSFLQELLVKLGYNLSETGYFGEMTAAAVRSFQQKNKLVVDGEAGIKTWTLLMSLTQPAEELGEKFLSEHDLQDFAHRYGVELASIKAVNEVESSGKGFLVDGRPKILFEGHIFWKELNARGLKPETLSNPSNSDVLYKNWTRVHYLSGVKEYTRLEKAATLISDPRVREAALASASWGSYQIMGFHAVKLGYSSVGVFVEEMKKHERNQLDAFGKYISTFRCLVHLKSKDWAKFAKCYNGPGFAQNKYDEKLSKAYIKYSQ